MHTNSIQSTVTTRQDRRPQPRRLTRRLRRIGAGTVTALTVIITLLTGVPILLLFFFTAVPVWISALLALLDLGIFLTMLRQARTPLQWTSGMLSALLVAGLAVLLSQQFAATPPITGADGRPLPGSIASLEKVTLNGSEQWVTIRGQDTELPVLLFLAGGPGGSELVMTRKYLSALEEQFIVVNWDQPGAGKSYTAVPFADLTPERYVADAHALTLYLQERFDQEKIYLFGESWGSILGVWLVQQHPELYHALVTTGQMVAPVENDIQMYEFALKQLIAQGKMTDVAQLVQVGPPPYAQDELLGNFARFNGVVNSYMHAHAPGEGTGHNLMFDSLAAPEYGLLDKCTGCFRC
jgi:pimeloyl-ACP methyl ester carboxylesterase